MANPSPAIPTLVEIEETNAKHGGEEDLRSACKDMDDRYREVAKREWEQSEASRKLVAETPRAQPRKEAL
ncbi:MAG: hypothetical protein K0R41_2441 [Geminicoccaceae bacterium]|nr:hypothetical protein [Geminicoccaceae bacterium]